MIKASELPPGTHFWANLDGKTAVICKAKDDYYMCGPWECALSEDDFEVLQIIPFPENYTAANLYFQ